LPLEVEGGVLGCLAGGVRDGIGGAGWWAREMPVAFDTAFAA
jgi:hypothetical protein